MYFVKQLTETVSLPPEYLGAHLDTLVRFHIVSRYEGHLLGTRGYVLAVLSIEAVQPACVQEGTGAALFPVVFTALLCKPCKNEVLQGTVAVVNKMGCFVQVGPMQVFVSGHLVPTGYRFDAVAMPPCFVNDQDGTISIGDIVRLKIVGTRIDASDIVAIGSMKEDFLGVVKRGGGNNV